MKNIARAAAAAAVLMAGAAQGADIYGGTSLKDSGPVVAGTTVNWTGIYVGGQVGYGNSNHKIEGHDTISQCDKGVVARDGQCYSWRSVDYHNDGTITPKTGATPIANATIKTTEIASAFVDGLNSKGVFGGLTLGGDIQRGNWLFGVFGDYNFSSADAKAGLTAGVCPNCLSANASIEDGDSWVIAARAGYLFGQEKRALIYVLGGYGQQDVSYHAGTNIPGSKDFNKDVTFGGFVAGAGGEYALTQNLFLSLEWQHFFGGKETLFDSGFVDCEANRLVVTDNMDSDKVMLKLKAKFGGVVDQLY